MRHALKEYKRKNIKSYEVSFDEDIGLDEESNVLTRHDVIGTPPEQEGDLIEGRVFRRVEIVAKQGGKDAAQRGRGGSHWREIIALRDAGYTLEEIGERLGKSHQAVHQALKRAQKRLLKKAA
jgi:hypothetical protein